ncbi:MAG: hypothetical protein RMK29_10375 [Myxococcales bacterium]|nr:hypothetical protein [Myxococcota bacterium]MDW8282108.1 hypothetical protein [Myxococcales bacterium]
MRQVLLEEDGYLLRRIGAAQLVVAMRQAAADAAARSGVEVVYALAPDPPPGAIL